MAVCIVRSAMRYKFVLAVSVASKTIALKKFPKHLLTTGSILEGGAPVPVKEFQKLFGIECGNKRVMVSTRGVKYKFCEGERVLCYEPDPTKAKVLYDSKVLDVVVNKDQRGRRNIEYLIHFQGWNSSWDRHVREEFVLKDTPENRQLQKDLAEKSQLQIGAYLYRRERKKLNQKPSDRITQSSEDGSSGSPAQIDTEESISSSEDDSSVEEDCIPVELTEDLRNILEHDYHLVNNRNKLMKLPTEPNVINILESYWRHYAMSLLCGSNEKAQARYRSSSTKLKPEELQRNLTICKEMLDGLRIYFDFTLSDLLLYKKEQAQVETAQARYLSSIPSVKQEVLVKTELEDLEFAHLPNMETDDDNYDNLENDLGHRITTRRRGLRSGRSLEADSNGLHESSPPTNRTSTHSASNLDVAGPTTKLLSWKLLPDHVYNQQPLPPSLVYGATHLLRLLVKLPELLNVCSIGENKLKVLLQHVDLFIDYLDNHKEWYGDKFYVE